MLTICLHNIKCTAYHGVHKEEQQLGSSFLINVEVDLKNNRIEHLDETINYEVLYTMIHNYMKQSKALLESVAQDIGDGIFNRFLTQVKSVRVTIEKMSPPIAHFNGNVLVKYQVNT